MHFRYNPRFSGSLKACRTAMSKPFLKWAGGKHKAVFYCITNRCSKAYTAIL